MTVILTYANRDQELEQSSKLGLSHGLAGNINFVFYDVQNEVFLV